MLNNIKVATKDTFIYSLGNISTKIIGLVLLPLYTEKLSVAEYGVLGTVEITIQVLAASFSLSLYQALNRWYWDKEYRRRQKSIFFTILISMLGGAILLIILFVPFSSYFSKSILGSVQYAYLFRLLLIDASLQIIARLFLTLMRLERKPILFTTTNIIKLIITLGLTIYFVAGLKRGVEGIIEAQIIGFAVFMLINSRYLLRSIEPVFETSILKEMIRFSYPLVISTISGVILTVTDRYVLRYMEGLSEMGLYNLGFKLANVLKIFVINSIMSGLMPLRFKMMDNPNNKRFYSKTMTYTAYGFIILLLVLSMFSKEVIRVLAHNSDYWGAFHIVPILCFAQLFELLRQNSRFGLIVEKKTKIISSILIIVAILNLGLNILLVSFFSSYGAAMASLISQLAFFGLIHFYAQKYYPIPYEMKKIWMMVFVSVIFVAIVYLGINSMNLLPRLLIKIFLVLIFPVVLYFFNFYEPVELLRLKQSWRKWRNPLRWRKNLHNIHL